MALDGPSEAGRADGQGWRLGQQEERAGQSWLPPGQEAAARPGAGAAAKASRPARVQAMPVLGRSHRFWCPRRDLNSWSGEIPRFGDTHPTRVTKARRGQGLRGARPGWLNGVNKWPGRGGGPARSTAGSKPRRHQPSGTARPRPVLWPRAPGPCARPRRARARRPRRAGRGGRLRPRGVQPRRRPSHPRLGRPSGRDAGRCRRPGHDQAVRFRSGVILRHLARIELGNDKSKLAWLVPSVPYREGIGDGGPDSSLAG